MAREKPEKVAVIGGSMAGLFAAINLKSIGFDVTVFERSNTSLANRGAGIATHNELYDALHSASIIPRQKMGVESNGRILLDTNGRIIQKKSMPQTMSSWGLIYRFLRAQISDLEYNGGCSLADITYTKNGKVKATFENRSSSEADWIIGADGMNSQVRQIVEPSSKPEYAGYLAWRGLIDEGLIDKKLISQLANVITFGLAPAGHWLGYLVAGKGDTLQTGKRWYNWGWYRHATEQALREHLTSDDGTYFKNGIPHHLIREVLIKEMRHQASKFLAPQIREIIQLTRHPFLQGMFDVGCKNLIHGRIILIGDAAFTARPHVGLGVSKAAQDASTLARALSSKDKMEALQKWETERKQYGSATILWGRDLGSHIEPIDTPPKEHSKAAYYSSPGVLITQNASHEPHKFLSDYL